MHSQVDSESFSKPGPPKSIASLRSLDSSSGSIQNGVVRVHTERSRLGQQGFLRGDFASGQVFNLHVDDCFVAEAAGSLLAVGELSSLVLYETTQFTEVFRMPRKTTISALCWLDTSILASADQGGRIVVSQLDPEIVEIDGLRTLWDYQGGAEVRGLSCSHCGGELVVAAGDKAGYVHLWSTLGDGVTHIREQSPVLAVALNRSVLAVGTKGGEVKVYRLTTHNGLIGVDPSPLWSTTRAGPVRSTSFFGETREVLAFGGYDKKVVMVDTRLWTAIRELRLEGTICTISTDAEQRYLVVGCRDKSLALFDTSTYTQIKSFSCPGWVTAATWISRDRFVMRSDRSCLAVLDMSPIRQTSRYLSSRHDGDSAIAWKRNYIARALGNSVFLSDSSDPEFRDVASFTCKSPVVAMAFDPTGDRLAVIDRSGILSLMELLVDEDNRILRLLQWKGFEEDPKAVAWSSDGTSIALGGKSRRLTVVNSSNLSAPAAFSDFSSKVWDISFLPVPTGSFSIAVALGDYSVQLLDSSLRTALTIPRTRTARCVSFMPESQILAVGDGAGIVALVDVQREELLYELEVGGRVNTIAFSPCGDFMVVGTDNHEFAMYETKSYVLIQIIRSAGFAQKASFSPCGAYLVLGQAEASYSVVRLGPLLSIDLVPSDNKFGTQGELPERYASEILHRSGDGPSFVQRLMLEGGTGNLNRIQTIVQSSPQAIYSFNRSTGEGWFDTAVSSGNPSLLRLALLSLVDGSISPRGRDRPTLLATDIPRCGRDAMMSMIATCPPEHVVDVLQQMKASKVPYAVPQNSELVSTKIRGSSSFTDPWPQSSQIDLKSGSTKSSVLIPAVLPLPGLGDMDFLSSLLASCPPAVFDNPSMALVLRVLWTNHIRKFFLLDVILFLLFYGSWVVLVELSTSSAMQIGDASVEGGFTLAVLVLNSVYGVKELVESRYGRRLSYFRSVWNLVDMSVVLAVYAYLAELVFRGFESSRVTPWAVVASLLLTVKLLAYLRGFSETGWLVSVLAANFRDVRGFLLILLAIVTGFSLSFRAIFGPTGDEAYQSLRRSFLSTFELTIIGSYEPDLLYQARSPALAIVVFIAAVTCVLVVVLNALISVLADSYARVQQDAVANRRREQAELIVEYMSLLPPSSRRSIERNSQWFHTLLAVDSDGDLLHRGGDWEGGLNALRKDMSALVQRYDSTIGSLKTDVDKELQDMRADIMTALQSIAQDVRAVKKGQMGPFTGKNVAKAVSVVKSIGRKKG